MCLTHCAATGTAASLYIKSRSRRTRKRRAATARKRVVPVLACCAGRAQRDPTRLPSYPYCMNAWNLTLSPSIFFGYRGSVRMFVAVVVFLVSTLCSTNHLTKKAVQRNIQTSWNRTVWMQSRHFRWKTTDENVRKLRNRRAATARKCVVPFSRVVPVVCSKTLHTLIVSVLHCMNASNLTLSSLYSLGIEHWNECLSPSLLLPVLPLCSTNHLGFKAVHRDIQKSWNRTVWM